MSGREEVLAVTAGLVAAWNRGDARGFAALFAEDADYVAGSGLVFHGREAIARLLAEARGESATGSGDGVVALSDTRVRMVRDDVAIVRASWRQVPKGGAAAVARQGVFSLVLARSGGVWPIVALQNTDAETAEEESPPG